MEGLLSLTKKSSPSNFLYIAERAGSSLIDKVCKLGQFFVQGVLMVWWRVRAKSTNGVYSEV